MAVLTLNQAAKAAKKSKSTIQYALKTGRLSGFKDEKGNYQIDTSELFRVYDSNAFSVDERTTLEHIETDVKTALLVQKLEFLEHRLDKLEQEKNEISRRLDKSEEERRETQAKLTALLTFQQEQPAKVQEQSVKKENKLWKKLFR
jgi:hypothetical protein